VKTVCQHIPTFSVSFADSSLIEGGGEQSEPEGVKKRAEPAFTSAEACRASKSCSRGRFCAIPYMLKKTAFPDWCGEKRLC